MRPKANWLRGHFVSGLRELKIAGKPPLLGICSMHCHPAFGNWQSRIIASGNVIPTIRPFASDD